MSRIVETIATPLITAGVNKICHERANKKPSLLIELFKNPDAFSFSLRVKGDEIIIKIRKESDEDE